MRRGCVFGAALAYVLVGSGCRATELSKVLATTAPGSSLDVREAASKPRLARLTRDGDPTGAVTLALATPSGRRRAPLENRALGTLLSERLSRVGVHVMTTTDGAGIRITARVGAELDVRRALDAFEGVVEARVTEAEFERVRNVLATRIDARLPSTLLPIVACSGDDALVVGEGIDSVTLANLDAWREATLELGGVALGVVGTKATTEAAARALDDGPPWPLHAKRNSDPRAAPSHAATISAVPGASVAELDLAWDVPDPRVALRVAQELRARRAPLMARLGQDGSGFRLSDVHVTARRDGGCLRLRLTNRNPARDKAIASAARIVAWIATDLTQTGGGTPDDALVTTVVAGSDDARLAAEKAAWWSLAASAGADEPVMHSLLQLAPQRADAANAEVEFDAAYQSELAALRTPPRSPQGTFETTRFAFERGQRESWFLLTNACTDLGESERDAGMLAAGAVAAASLPNETGVFLEPWVGPDAVGVLAHASPRDGEPSDVFARRVAAALGAAVTAIPISTHRFAHAQSKIVSALLASESRVDEALASALLPRAPSVISPFGLLDGQLAMRPDDVDARWRVLLREPWRLVGLTTTSDQEGNVVANELARWFAPTPRTACPAPKTRALPSPSDTRGIELAGRTVARAAVAIACADGTRPGDIGLYAAALETSLRQLHSGGGARVSVRTLGGRRAPTLVIDVISDDGDMTATLDGVAKVLLRMRERGLEPAEHAAAAAAMEARRVAVLSTAHGRLEALLTSEPVLPPTIADAQVWAARNFIPGRIVTLRSAD